MAGRVDELTVNAQRRSIWILLCLPFVLSLVTTVTRSSCGAMRITDIDVGAVYRQSFEGSCTRVSVARVKRTWTRGCASARPAQGTCTTEDVDLTLARWVFGVIAAVSVLAGLWRRSLASVTVDHGTRTVRVEAEGQVVMFNFADRPAVVKEKKGFVIQASSRDAIALGKSPDPRDIALLRDCLAALG